MQNTTPPPRRIPAHPGAFIREITLPEPEIGKAELAMRLKISRQALENILKEKSAITPKMAVKLALVIGGTPQGWMQMQVNHDLANAKREIRYRDYKPVFATA